MDTSNAQKTTTKRLLRIGQGKLLVILFYSYGLHGFFFSFAQTYSWALNTRGALIVHQQLKHTQVLEKMLANDSMLNIILNITIIKLIY